MRSWPRAKPTSGSWWFERAPLSCFGCCILRHQDLTRSGPVAMQNILSQLPSIPILIVSIMVLLWILPLLSRRMVGSWRTRREGLFGATQRSQKSVESTAQFLLDSFSNDDLGPAVTSRISKTFWIGPRDECAYYLDVAHRHDSQVPRMAPLESKGEVLAARHSFEPCEVKHFLAVTERP
jgi:hypothetical protein